MKALVLGIGNILLSDEGIGVIAVEELRHRYDFPNTVEVVDGGTAGLELLSYFESKDHLIIIDAIAANHPPGTVMRVEGQDVHARFMERISPHQIGLSDVLAAARLTLDLPPSLTLFGMEPYSLSPGIGLSPIVEIHVDKLITSVIAELASWGYAVATKASIAADRQFWFQSR